MCAAIFHYGQEAHDPRPMSHIHFGYPKALTKQKGTSICWDANKMIVFLKIAVFYALRKEELSMSE